MRHRLYFRSFSAWTTLALTLVIACAGPLPVGTADPGTSAAAGTATPGDAQPSPDASAPAATTPGSSAGSPSSIFDPPDPLDVAVVLDTEKMVEALIPVEGGSITATGADGTVYTLDIPADALLVETMIGLTPVTSVTGMPFGTQTHAVQLSPDGLSLFNHVILTIAPTEDIPVAEQVVFGYLEDGKDVILAAPVVDSSDIKINVLHFSGNGVTKGLLALDLPIDGCPAFVTQSIVEMEAHEGYGPRRAGYLASPGEVWAADGHVFRGKARVVLHHEITDMAEHRRA